MNKYQALTRLIGTVSQEIYGMPVAEAVEYIEGNGLRVRLVRIDGDACMCTQDVKMDRIGLITNGGVVTGMRYG